MALIEGPDGVVRTGSTHLLKLTNIEISIDQETTTQGPFIEDSNTATVRTGLSAAVTGEGFLTTPMDAGHNTVIDTITAGTDLPLTIEVGAPAVQTFNCATMILTNVTVGLDSGEGAPISFEAISNGAFTIT